MLITVVIAMVVAVLLVPGMLMLLRRSAELAATSADNDEGLAARAELAELFGSIDPIGACTSPVGGSDAAYRDKCFREQRWAGASLIEAPDLPAGNPPGYGACWLASQEGGPRQRKCIVLEGDSDQMECADTPTGPCLKVLSESDEADGEPVLVDRHGGGLLLIRSWDETDSDGDPTTVPFLPHEWTKPPTDRLIYTDVEWWCLRWRSPSPDGSGGVTPWAGDCPAPADPCERIPPPGTKWNAGWSSQFQTWTTRDAEDHCTRVRDDLSVLEAVPADDADSNGTPDGPHTIADRRITDVELLVCVASDRSERLKGAAHCAVDRMRFTVADAFGSLPPAPRLEVNPAVAADGLTVEEGSEGSFNLRLGLEPSADVTVTVNAPPGLTLNAPSGVSLTPVMLTLTFTPDNWNEPQTITVEVIDDTNAEPAETVTVTLTATTPTDPDSEYDGVAVEVQVTVPPSDRPALTVDPGSVTVAENGTAEFTVRLEAPPLFLVTVEVTSDDTAVASAAPTPLRFTTTDWKTEQTVTVTGVDDADISDESAVVSLKSLSVDGDYNSLLPVTVAVTVTDDDEPALVVNPDSLTVDENGTATLDVSLATLPSAAVTVTVASADTAVATVTPATLTFTTSNWSTTQTITINGTDDTNADESSTTVTITASDGGYTNATATVAVTVTDDDTPPRFTAADADAYVAARECIVATLPPALQDFYNTNPTTYAGLYQNAEINCRGSVPSDIPLGEADPNSLPGPADPQALRDAIDVLAVAAGLPQSLIDAAEGG